MSTEATRKTATSFTEIWTDTLKGQVEVTACIVLKCHRVTNNCAFNIQE